jgi:hypothetical protein
MAEEAGYYVQQKVKTLTAAYGWWELDLVIWEGLDYWVPPALVNARVIVEVGDKGDDSRHNKTRGPQAIKDSYIEGHCKDNYPEVQFRRINKDDTTFKDWSLKYLGLK